MTECLLTQGIATAFVLVPTALCVLLYLLDVCSALVESISERWGRIKTNLNL